MKCTFYLGMTGNLEDAVLHEPGIHQYFHFTNYFVVFTNRLANELTVQLEIVTKLCFFMPVMTL
jgi:hypothetical protein